MTEELTAPVLWLILGFLFGYILRILSSGKTINSMIEPPKSWSRAQTLNLPTDHQIDEGCIEQRFRAAVREQFRVAELRDLYLTNRKAAK